MKKILLLLTFLAFFRISADDHEYGWVQDIVGIDEKAFNYAEGSDPDLEIYVKNLFLIPWSYHLMVRKLHF